MTTTFFWSTKTALLVTCVLSSIALKVYSAPLSSDKSGEDQVKDAVRKAEAAATLAAESSVKRTHKPETSANNEKASRLSSESEETSVGHAAKKVNLLTHHMAHSRSDDDDDGDHAEAVRVKEHRVHRKPGLSHLMGMNELGDIGNSNSASYKEDTKLEDRLALEAEEQKKYDDGYGGNQWDDGPQGGKGGSWSNNIQKQDAAEKQSIQAQVASESAHELNEIQQAVAAESQSSRGVTSMGDQGASVIQIGHNENQAARYREDEPHTMEGGASFEAPRYKSYAEPESHMSSEPREYQQQPGQGMQQYQSFNQGGQEPREYQQEGQGIQQYQSSNQGGQDISNLLRQSTKLSPSELEGAKQFTSESLGGMGNSFGGQSIQRYTQGSQEGAPMEMSNSFAGSEISQLGNQMGGRGAQIQEMDPQKEAFSAGSLQGASMETAGLHGNAFELGGNGMQNMQSMQNMGSLSAAGFTGEQQQQQPLVTGMQGMMGGGSIQSLGAAAANGLTGMQSYGGIGAGYGGVPSFGGSPMGMSFKKSLIERPDVFQEIQDSKSWKR